MPVVVENVRQQFKLSQRQSSIDGYDARIKLLWLKEERLRELLGEIYFKLKEDTEDVEFYKDLFTKLVLQSLCIMMEKNVGIRIRKQDRSLIKELIPAIVERFEEMSQIRVKFEVDARIFLDEDSLGGVVMFSQRGCIKLENTIRSRLGLIWESVSAFIRYELFGVNPHRKFSI